MTEQTNDIIDLVSELASSEKKERSKLNKLIAFSKKLKKKLLIDSENIKKRKAIVDEIIRGKELRSELKQLSIQLPKRELSFGKKDTHLVEKIIELTKNNIGKEDQIKREVHALYRRVSPESQQKLSTIFRHVSGEETLDKKELELELKSIKVFHLILHYIQKKTEMIKKQEHLIKTAALRELHNTITDEEHMNNRLLTHVNDVLGIETTEKKLEEEKARVIKHVAPSHTKRNVLVLVIVLVLLGPALFKQAGNLFAEEPVQLAMSINPDKGLFEETVGSNTKTITAKEVNDALTDPKIKAKINVKAKADFIDSLKHLYYFSVAECSAKKCLLDNTAVEALLPKNKDMKKSALSASEISLKGNRLTILSKEPLVAPAPGGKGGADIYLHNTEWSVLENKGDFEFNLVNDGKVWVETKGIRGFFGSFLINKMTNVKRARLFKYKREDNTDGLYGILYSDEVSDDIKEIKERFAEKGDIEVIRETEKTITYRVKNGVDLATEEVGTVNKFPKEETQIAQLFSQK